MTIVKSVIPFAPNASHIAYMTIKPDENNGLEPGTVTLQATTEGVGKNVSTLQAIVDGSEQRIIFNAKYLHEYLAVLKTSRVALELVSPVRPTVFIPVDIIDYTYVRFFRTFRAIKKYRRHLLMKKSLPKPCHEKAHHSYTPA